MMQFKPTPHFNSKDGKPRGKGTQNYFVLFFKFQPIIFSILIMLMFFEIIPLVVSTWISPIIQIFIVISAILLLSGLYQLVYKEKILDRNLSKKDFPNFKNSWELYIALFMLFWVFVIGWKFVFWIYFIAINCVLILRFILIYKMFRNKKHNV